MYTSMWFVSIIAMLVAEVRTGALLKKESEFLRCAQCSTAEGACAAGRRAPAPCAARAQRCATVAAAPESEFLRCAQCSTAEGACAAGRRAPAPCAARAQRCATVAAAPDFTSVLTCAPSSPRHPCSLHYSSKQDLMLTCTCFGQLCNAPFSTRLRSHLFNFTSAANSTDLTDDFFKPFNVSKDNLYEMITTKFDSHLNDTPPVTTLIVEHLGGLNVPRAEALKHEATEPSDDEEDEGEGSGSDEELRPRRPAAPAAPSSFLPSDENKAPPLLVNFLLITGILFVTL